MTTAEKIRTLQIEAGQAGDDAQVAICDIALHGSLDEDRAAKLTEADRAIVAQCDTQAKALAECLRVIADPLDDWKRRVSA